MRRFESNALLSATICTLLRVVGRTWRFHLHDETNLSWKGGDTPPPLIWAVWHNRLIVVPLMYERYFRDRKGVVLISRSRDGGILADCIERFGGFPVRGSTSRGGASALRQLQRRVLEGWDVYLTPDGPKGPRYNVGAGSLWLAQATGAAILPVSMECSSCWRLGRWDAFIIPKPFSRVDVTLRALHHVPPALTDESIKAEQERLKEVLMNQTRLH